MKDADFIIEELKSLQDIEYAQKMAHFGIDNSKALGIRIPRLRTLAKNIGIYQSLSLALWELDYHEAKLFAILIGDYKQVTKQQIDRWAKDFYSWDICDLACGNLFIHTPYWKIKSFEFVKSGSEYIKRAGFVLMAEAAIHHKTEDDNTFFHFLPIIEEQASDTRNFVKKAINWALRQIGKRSIYLHACALKTANNILTRHNKKSHWIARDALRELNSEAVLTRLKVK